MIKNLSTPETQILLTGMIVVKAKHRQNTTFSLKDEQL